MKKYKIIIIIMMLNCFAYIKADCQITDTLQWLKSRIEQNSYYIGKPLGVLLDSIRLNGVYVNNNNNWEVSGLIFSDDQPAHTLPRDTAWTNNFSIYFGKLFGINGAGHIHDLSSTDVNTHLIFIDLTFTQKIPFPTKLTADPDMCGLFGPVENICRPYIVASIKVGEY